MTCIKRFHRHGQRAACLAQQSLRGLQSLLAQLLCQQRNLSSQNNNGKNKGIIKQKNQSAQKNVNSFCKILDGVLRRGKLLVLDLELWNRRYGFSEAYLNAITHI